MQLDIFADSRDVMLRYDVIAAIEARQAQPAQLALAKLEGEYPQDRLLTALNTLVHSLAFPPGRFANSAAALVAREHLATAIQAAAAQLMAPAQARPWIAQAWRLLAQAAAGLGYAPDAPQAHSAPSFLRAGDWADAETAVMAIASWRRIPLPLAWMAEARLGREGFAAALPFLCELAWMAPAAFAELVGRLKEPRLKALLYEFDAEFENDLEYDTDPDQAWFPAWCLLKEPSLAPLLRQTEPGQGKKPERAARLILDLLSLEQKGSQPVLLAQRKKLRGLHAGLFARYMRTR
jgi:hypothetical protein